MRKHAYVNYSRSSPYQYSVDWKFSQLLINSLKSQNCIVSIEMTYIIHIYMEKGEEKVTSPLNSGSTGLMRRTASGYARACLFLAIGLPATACTSSYVCHRHIMNLPHPPTVQHRFILFLLFHSIYLNIPPIPPSNKTEFHISLFLTKTKSGFWNVLVFRSLKAILVSARLKAGHPADLHVYKWHKNRNPSSLEAL